MAGGSADSFRRCSKLRLPETGPLAPPGLEALAIDYSSQFLGALVAARVPHVGCTR
jgi:hypothetical protein